MVSLQEMLDMQSRLQKEAYGADYETMTDEERMASVRENVLALEDELHEFLGETGWKPWTSSNHINREAAKGELIDAWHFFMNLCLHVGLTAEEFGRLYIAKNRRNLERQREGYDGLNKCPGCKRALDDPAVSCFITPGAGAILSYHCVEDHEEK